MEKKVTLEDAVKIAVESGFVEKEPLFQKDTEATGGDLKKEVLAAETCEDVAGLTKNYPYVSESEMLRISPHIEKCEECRKMLKER